jgi:alcohol dehydrogenase
VPAVTPGRILGHEAVGTVVETGIGVQAFREGDRMLVSSITSCGRCAYCRKGQYSQCQGSGWVFGHLIDRLQAEYARVPSPTRRRTRCPSASRRAGHPSRVPGRSAPRRGRCPAGESLGR